MTTNQAASDPVGNIATAIPAKFVLSRIPMQMFGADPMPNANDGPFEQAEKPLAGVGVRLDPVNPSHELATGVIDHHVTAHLAAKPLVDGEFIGREHAISVQPSKQERVDGLGARGRDGSGSCATTALDCSEQHRLVRASPTTPRRRSFAGVAAFAPDIAFVDFDDARQRRFVATVQHGANAVSDKPCGLLSDAKVLTELDAANSLGRRQDQVEGEVPDTQRQVRAMHRRADRDAELFAAGVAAMPAWTSSDWLCVIDRAAVRAGWSMRPANAFQVRSTGVVGVETLHESDQFHLGHLKAVLKHPASKSVCSCSVNFLTLVGLPRRQSVEGGGASHTFSRSPRYPFSYESARASNRMRSSIFRLSAHLPFLNHKWSQSLVASIASNRSTNRTVGSSRPCQPRREPNRLTVAITLKRSPLRAASALRILDLAIDRGSFSIEGQGQSGVCTTFLARFIWHIS